MKEVIEDLKRDEGFDPHVYIDTNGYLSIGYGTNLEAGITRGMAECLMVEKINDYYLQIGKRWPKFHELSDARKNVLMNMAYNLGVNGLFKFKKMIAALEKDDYRQAAKEILDSKAGRQLKARYGRLHDKMIAG